MEKPTDNTTSADTHNASGYINQKPSDKDAPSGVNFSFSLNPPLTNREYNAALASGFYHCSATVSGVQDHSQIVSNVL